MTQLEKDQKRTDLLTKQQMLEDELRALEATPVTTYKVWEPEYGITYWAFTGAKYTNARDSGDKLLLSCGLSHPTKEAAERHHSFLVMLHDLHKFAVEHNEGWKPDYTDCKQDKYQVEYSTLPSRPGFSVESFIWYTSALPCFKSQEIAQKAIDTFGDRLKILFEYYNS